MRNLIVNILILNSERSLISILFHAERIFGMFSYFMVLSEHLLKLSTYHE